MSPEETKRILAEQAAPWTQYAAEDEVSDTFFVAIEKASTRRKDKWYHSRKSLLQKWQLGGRRTTSPNVTLNVRNYHARS